jgi:hypothetical protein
MLRLFRNAAAIVQMKRFDMFAELDDDAEAAQRMRDDAVEKLRAAAAGAALEENEEKIVALQLVSELSAEIISDSTGKSRRMDEIEKPDFERIKLTKHVTKWLGGVGRGSDVKLRNIFLQRIRQLAAGDKSRILQKKLAGAKNIYIYETYMDGNFRILWTEDTKSDDINLGLVIWYVSNEDCCLLLMCEISD